jgi:hypothetical protein
MKCYTYACLTLKRQVTVLQEKMKKGSIRNIVWRRVPGHQYDSVNRLQKIKKKKRVLL